MVFNIIDNNLFLTILAYEYLVNKRSVNWLACNFDKDVKDIYSYLEKIKDVKVSKVLVPKYQDIKDRSPKAYVQALLNGIISPVDGELGNPFPFDGAGLYYSLPKEHREQFDRIQDRMVIDALYRHMSITGIANKYNVEVHDARDKINSYGPFLYAGSLCRRSVLKEDDIIELAILNEFSTDTKHVFDFIFNSSLSIEKYCASKLLEEQSFTKDVIMTLHDCYCTMRNKNAVFSPTEKHTHISGFTVPHEPFNSVYLYKDTMCLV